MEGINPTAVPWFWIESGDNWLYAYTVHWLATSDVPSIISISYGWYEWDQCEEGIGSDDCNTYNLTDATFVTRVNTQFQKMGTAGITIFVASGDSGCHTRYDPTCSLPYLLADFPSSSTFVTSVGATEVSFTGIDYNFKAAAPACTDATLNFSCVWNGTETAVDINRAYFSSGGGFSNISAPGSFQAKAISGYLNSGVALPPASYFDPNGRGYPDIAANGHNGLIVLEGEVGLIGGTSQSSPFAAGIFALLADTYVSITKKPFGYLNPLLYSMWEAQPNTFTDITVGDNKCPEGNTSPCPQCQGYLAAKGWDPVTGLGTPNFANIKSYITNQANKVVARRAMRTSQPTRKF
jgi:tripeptidyl-peptidase-1